jgi:hypothetical protein
MRYTLCLAAAAATAFSAAPAFAQVVPAAPVATDTANAEARGVVLQPLTLTKIDDLDFGTVVGSAAAGTVTIDPDTGVRTVSGGVTEVPSYPGQRGLFQGAGTAAQDVLLTLSAPTVLVSTTNAADNVTVNSMTLDNNNATTRTIDSTSAFTVGVGGVFGIAANQPNGKYVAQFDLTADYQ